MQLELETNYIDELLHGTLTEGLDEKALREIRKKISPTLHDKLSKEIKEFLLQTMTSHASVTATAAEGQKAGGEGQEGTSVNPLDLGKAHDFITSVLQSKLLRIEMDASLRVLVKFAKDAQNIRTGGAGMY